MSHSPLRRWTVQLALAVILGAMTTVAVAWVCIELAEDGPGETVPISPDNRQLLIDLYQRDKLGDPPKWRSYGWRREWIQWKEVTRAETRFWESFGYRYSGHVAIVPYTCFMPTGESDRTIRIGLTDTAQMWQREACFPMLCFSQYLTAGHWPDDHELLYHPIVSATLINTPIFAVPWFFLLFAPGIIRRTLREKRGRCPTCGYNLRGEFGDGCSECGWNRTSQEPIS